ncbi:ornithine aminotransferase [Pseudomonas sp. AF76]|uniref:BON domain-containing protein n=1 Tax=Pseudomonas TaxID=286 RepID=UPI000F47060C|nr:MULTISPECIES: BON domain-containing protein [Pseudomonas]MDT8909226.1 BON domain-containing protein [Pseudomonas prosekii]ROO39648.1 ornithine aminotransferase [Pseudomonas sp. AF76]
MSDLSLRQHILEELEFHPDINAANIGATVDNGVVTLSGHVSSYAEKINAERAVKSIRGVRALAQEIQVRPDKNAGTTDDAIAARALSIIAWSSDVPEQDINITVQNGWVTLEGQVDWQYQKEAVERAVHKLSGVVAIDNRLALRARVNVEDVRQRIEQALKRNAEVDAQRIQVKVEGDTVKLQGRVHLWRERKIAERAAWSVPGVRQVEDHLLLA